MTRTTPKLQLAKPTSRVRSNYQANRASDGKNNSLRTPPTFLPETTDFARKRFI